MITYLTSSTSDFGHFQIFTTFMISFKIVNSFECRREVCKVYGEKKSIKKWSIFNSQNWTIWQSNFHQIKISKSFISKVCIVSNLKKLYLTYFLIKFLKMKNVNLDFGKFTNRFSTKSKIIKWIILKVFFFSNLNLMLSYFHFPINTLNAEWMNKWW